jgi:outer membrane protein OmpA-like peptidoglycan-associated protein
MLKLTGIIEFAFGAAKDSDGDGVPDRRDKCPDTPPGVQVDEDGCPLDRDGDGIPDYKDDCPDEAGPAKFNGCPDTDGDGIPDKDDECPTVPGLAKFNGCPDTDGDGVPDHRDDCPDTPKGCPVDERGCPLDSDGDGVIDCEDRCPNEPGPASNQGCPDWEQLEIPTIYFDFDKSNLKEAGKAELDKLATKLNASKEYDIVIGGHADSTGPEDYNMRLSERRAQEVVKYLLMKGVNNAYVGSNNYGETKPAVPNNSKSNRALNRRAEFEVAKIRK